MSLLKHRSVSLLIEDKMKEMGGNGMVYKRQSLQQNEKIDSKWSNDLGVSLKMILIRSAALAKSIESHHTLKKKKTKNHQCVLTLGAQTCRCHPWTQLQRMNYCLIGPFQMKVSRCEWHCGWVSVTLTWQSSLNWCYPKVVKVPRLKSNVYHSSTEIIDTTDTY